MLEGVAATWRLLNVTTVTSGTVTVNVTKSVSMLVVVTGVLNVKTFGCVDVNTTVFVRLVTVLLVWDDVCVAVLGGIS